MKLKELKRVIGKKLSKMNIRCGVELNELDEIIYVIADCRNWYNIKTIRTCINNILRYLYVTKNILYVSRDFQEGNLYIAEIFQYK